jgi:predicted nucleic acid-binding Zn ribbon protein
LLQGNIVAEKKLHRRQIAMMFLYFALICFLAANSADTIKSLGNNDKPTRKYWTSETTSIVENQRLFATVEENSCRFAQLKCSYRTGCGSTLQSFIIECDGLIHNKTNVCSETCKNTLVGLTSTLEGQNS